MSITNGTLIKQGRYWHWKYQLDGETRWESLKVEGKRDAEKARQKRIAEYHRDHDKFKRWNLNPLITDFEEAYFKWAEDHKRPKTIEIEKNFWNQFTEFTRAKRLKDIKKQDVERFKRRLKHKGMRGRPLKEESINDALRHLQAIFNHGVKLHLFDGDNPVKGIARYKLHKKQPEFLSSEEIERLLTAAEAHSQSIYWVYLLGIYTGMRRNELANTRWEWFDFNEKLIKVKRHDGFEIKDSEERIIPMSERVHNALFPHRKDTGFIFSTTRATHGKSIYRYDPRKSMKIVAEKAEVSKANFQLLRHTFGSQHAIAGTSIYKIAKWMGHSTIEITARHYAGLQEYDKDIDRF